MPTTQRQIPWVRYWDTVARGLPSGVCQVDDACMAAWETFGHESASRLFGDNPLACDPDIHPDAHIIGDWLESSGREATEMQVAFWLAYFVRNEWSRRPKPTPAKHRALYQRISELCIELSAAMDATGNPYQHGGGHGLTHACTRALLTDVEVDCFVYACNMARGIETKGKTPSIRDRDLWEYGVLGCFGLPTMQELLERVATIAERLKAEGPIHVQPAKQGAERGYFVRRTAQLFQRRYGEQPHEVIAALTTIALGEVTDRALVAKLLA